MPVHAHDCFYMLSLWTEKRQTLYFLWHQNSLQHDVAFSCILCLTSIEIATFTKSFALQAVYLISVPVSGYFILQCSCSSAALCHSMRLTINGCCWTPPSAMGVHWCMNYACVERVTSFAVSKICNFRKFVNFECSSCFISCFECGS
jgi:hypothetical protein